MRQSFLFNAEYPMVRWLEANGYDVKYISGVDTDRRAADLVGAKKPKVFFSVGHDEYWSAGQRASVEAARDAGRQPRVLQRQRDLLEDAVGAEHRRHGTPYRTLVSYKDTLRRRQARSDAGRGDRHVARHALQPADADGGRPENSLIGTIWTVNSGTSAITVPAAMANLRFWRNTRVATLTPAAATLGADTLGYEWDEDLDNGARPSGLIHLSSTTVDGVEKIARLRRDGRHRHRDAQPDALPSRERRARLRRRHRAVGVGALDEQSRPRARTARPIRRCSRRP